MSATMNVMILHVLRDCRVERLYRLLGECARLVLDSQGTAQFTATATGTGTQTDPTRPDPRWGGRARGRAGRRRRPADSLPVPPVPSGPSWRAAAGRAGYAGPPGPEVGAPLCLNRASVVGDPTEREFTVIVTVIVM